MGKWLERPPNKNLLLSMSNHVFPALMSHCLCSVNNSFSSAIYPSTHLTSNWKNITLDNELLCAHTLLSKDLRENLQTKIQLIHGDLKLLKQPFVCFTSYKQKLHGYIQLNMSQSPCSTSSIGYIQNDKAKMATVGYPKTEKFYLVLKK